MAKEWNAWRDDDPEILKIVTHDGSEYDVRAECSELAKICKPGEYCYIPYVEVRGYEGKVIAQFAQHSLKGVYFK